MHSACQNPVLRFLVLTALLTDAFNLLHLLLALPVLVRPALPVILAGTCSNTGKFSFVVVSCLPVSPVFCLSQYMLLILQTFIRQVVGGIVGAKGGEVAGEKKKNSESLGGVAGGVQYRRGTVGCIDRTIVMAGSRR